MDLTLALCLPHRTVVRNVRMNVDTFQCNSEEAAPVRMISKNESFHNYLLSIPHLARCHMESRNFLYLGIKGL